MSWTAWWILDGINNVDFKELSFYLFIILFPASIILIIFGIIAHLDLSLIYFFIIVLILSLIDGMLFFSIKEKK